MRNATLLAALAAVLALAPQAWAQCTGTEGVDFQRVTIDEINAVPDASLATLEAGGADLTISDIQDLLANDLVLERVEFTAVLLTDPFKSGVRSLNAQGFPNSIQAFVRDVAAVTEGPEGMGLQISDGGGTGTLQQFFVGDEIVFCGQVAPFEGSGGYATQLALESATGTGNAYGAGDPLLEPITISTDDIHDTYDIAGDPQTQIDWTAFADFNNQYVRFENLEVIQGIAGTRVSVLFSSPGEDSEISLYDASVCFRNDRGPEYFPAGQAPSCIDDDFVPPATGIVNVQGFLVFQGDDGAFDYSVPDEANFSIVPFEADDFEIAVAPPIVTVEDTGLATSADGAVVRATVVPGTSGNTVASVVVNYTTSSGATGQVTLANTSGDVYEGTITGLAAGDFVTYSIVATDNQGAATPATRTTTRRVVDGAVSSIFDVQVTPDGGVGGSGLTTAGPVAFDLDAVVQSVFFGGSLFTIQDDASLSPFSAVWVDVDAAADVVPGDRINISAARVVEDFGVTELQDVTFTKTGAGTPYAYKEVTTDLFNGADGADTAEQHEAMLLTFSDVTVVATNADAPAGPFGEFLISSDGTLANALRVDDFGDISYEGGDPGTVYAEGNTLAFVRGPLYFSFGNYKLTPTGPSDLGEIVVAREGDREATAFRIDSAYPNPSAGTLRVRFALDVAADVSLRVFDATGRQVATLAGGPLAAGAHTVEGDLAGLATGVYVLRLQAGGETATARIAVVR